MPSGITHIFLTKRLQDELPDGKLKNILAAYSDFLIVGAVGPDLPYASIVDNDFFFSNQNAMADNFHYRKTNQIPLKAFAQLKEMYQKIKDNRPDKIKEDLHQKMFAFFMGYTSHIFADGIIHPYVRDKVGDYAQNQSAHRSLEIQIDVLLVEEFTKKSGMPLELNYTNAHDELQNFETYPEAANTMQLFQKLINEVYGENYSIKTMMGWITGLHRLFAIAEGKHPKIYRELEKNTFLFKNRRDIKPDLVLTLTTPKDRSINFLKTPKVSFFNNCVPQYYKKYIAFAQKCFSFVYENGPALTETDIPPIDLDTGRLADKNDLNLIPELWK